MKLYYAPGACSLAAHIAFRELDLPVELVQVDLKTHRLADGTDYYTINPKGYVPAIVLDNGELLTEVAAILQYLGDRKPGLLAAAGTMERYRTIEWLTFVSSELHKGFAPLWHPETPQATRETQLDRLHKHFTLLDKHFAGHDFLLGDHFTVADAYAYAILNWSHFLRIDLTPWKHVRAYMHRVAARPRVQTALRAENAPVAA